mgnify:CR=1 FL=1
MFLIKDFFKDKISDLLIRMTGKRSDFMSQRENEVTSQLKELYKLEPATYKERTNEKEYIAEKYSVKYKLHSSCEKAIDELIRLSDRLI